MFTEGFLYLMLGTAGFLVIALGLITLIVRKREFIGSIIIMLGVCMIVFPSIQLEELKEEKQNSVGKISLRLNTSPENIIIKDLSEKRLFSPVKNLGLKEVVYDGKKYLVEVKEGEIISFAEAGDS